MIEARVGNSDGRPELEPQRLAGPDPTLGPLVQLDALDAYPGEWSEVLDSLAGKLHAIAGTHPDLDPG
jgi:hypothetical protein